jgi:CheY-like chemotaxis protein
LLCLQHDGGTRMKILVADCDGSHARELSARLRAQDDAFCVTLADAGENLLTAVRRVSPDIVIVDMARPDRDGLDSVRALNAQQMVPVLMFIDDDDPQAMASAAGLRGRRTELVVPMNLSTNGNAVTLASPLRDDFPCAGIAGLITGRRLRLAVVHSFSTHDLLLRHWLAAAGVNPDEDVEITVLPPAEMVSSLAAGAIDGYCAGAPWGQVAAHAGLGFLAAGGAAPKLIKL